MDSQVLCVCVCVSVRVCTCVCVCVRTCVCTDGDGATVMLRTARSRYPNYFACIVDTPLWKRASALAKWSSAVALEIHTLISCAR